MASFLEMCESNVDSRHPRSKRISAILFCSSFLKTRFVFGSEVVASVNVVALVREVIAGPPVDRSVVRSDCMGRLSSAAEIRLVLTCETKLFFSL